MKLITVVVPATESGRKVEVKVEYCEFLNSYFCRAFVDGMHFGMSDTDKEDVFDAISEALAMANSWATPIETHTEIAARMNAELLDYHELPSGELLIVFGDGVWLCDSNEVQIERVTPTSWMN